MSFLLTEIADLTSKLKENSVIGNRTAGALFYKTALRIAKARLEWEESAFADERPFFQEFRIGFTKKRVAIFQVENGQWSGSYYPKQKYCGDSLEKILKQMLDIFW